MSAEQTDEEKEKRKAALDRMREKLKDAYLIILEEYLESGAVTDPEHVTKYKNMRRMLLGEIR